MLRCSPYVSIPIRELKYNIYIPTNELTHNLHDKSRIRTQKADIKKVDINESSAIVVSWPFVSYT